MFVIVSMVTGSRDYRSAVEEVHHFFPRGLCCQSTEDLEIDKVNMGAEWGLTPKTDLKTTKVITITRPSLRGEERGRDAGCTRS